MSSMENDIKSGEILSSDATLTNIEEFFDRRGDIWIGAYREEEADWQKHWQFRQRVDRACELLRSADRGTALDLGCGAGHGLIRLSTMGFARVIGVDISERMVACAREAVQAHGLESSVEVHKGDVEQLERIPSASVDACMALGVIEYLDSDSALLAEVHRILMPAGVAVIQTRNAHCVPTQTVELIRRLVPSLRRENIEYRAHRPAEFRASAARSGFEVEREIFSHFHALFPFTLIPLIRRGLEPGDRWLSRPLERFGARPWAQWFASMHMLKLRKVSVPESARGA